MPEGHTLHRIAAELQEVFGGQKVFSISPQQRFAAEAVDGLELTSAQAWGKHLVMSFATLAEVVHIHLGLYGKWTLTPSVDVPVTGQVRWRIIGDAVTADLRGAAVCELLSPPELDELRARLGPDPLRSDSDANAAGRRIRKSRAPIATLLMDQSVIAGVGNIFRAEVLFRSGIDPLTPGRDISEEVWNEIWDDLVFLMRQAFDRGRIDTVRAEHEPDVMGRAPRVDEHGGEVYVYRRDGLACYVCGAVVETTVLNARNLFWCPQCQPAILQRSPR